MRPKIEAFRETADACHGNITKIAMAFGVARQTVHNWCGEDSEYRAVITDCKMRLYDQALEAARALTVGIPDIDKSGRLVGWIEKPDPSMVKYILSTLGKDEGFTERRDITSNGECIMPKVINILLDDGSAKDGERT